MDMDKTGGVSQPTPSASGRKGIWWAMLILSLVGLLISVVLARIHFKVNTEAGFHSFCGRGNTFNCDDVAMLWQRLWRTPGCEPDGPP